MPLFVFRGKDGMMDLRKIETLFEAKLKELGYSLYSLKVKKERKDLILEVIIDSVDPIDLNAIVDVTNHLNALLDENDPFEEAYTLDVSSLGAEKPLKKEDLHLYVNRYIHLHLINPVNGINIFEGNLDKVEGETLTLSYKDKNRTKTIQSTLSNIYEVRLAVKF